MKKPLFSILFHNYYGQHEYWLDYFFTTIRNPFTLFYNVVADSIHNLEEDVLLLLKEYRTKKKREDVKVILCFSPDKGKDIGGKLILLDSFLKMRVQAEYLIFLHDKKSPQAVTGHTWSEELISILHPPNLTKIIRLFEEGKKIGIIASKNFIVDEVDYVTGMFKSKNAPLLQKLCSQYGITVDEYLFVAGTIFVSRCSPIIDFFKQFSPLDIRKTLEAGNVIDDFEGTMTHSWERMLSWIVKTKGYNLKGI